MRFFKAGGLGLLLFGLFALLEGFFTFVYMYVGNWYFLLTTPAMVAWLYCFFKRLVYVKTTMYWIKQTETNLNWLDKE